MTEYSDELKKFGFLKNKEFDLIFNSVENAQQVVIQIHFVLVDNFRHDKN
jgi:hypothetical protein